MSNLCSTAVQLGAVSVAMFMALVDTSNGCTTFSLNILLMQLFLISDTTVVAMHQRKINSTNLFLQS